MIRFIGSRLFTNVLGSRGALLTELVQQQSYLVSKTPGAQARFASQLLNIRNEHHNDIKAITGGLKSLLISHNVPSDRSPIIQRFDGVQHTFNRKFHAQGSKVRYLDFRYKFQTNHLRSHLLIIRRQKMKKHQKRKWRKKYKSVIAKTRLKREIAKEKTFRVELLTMIRRAEQFDPKEYAMRKIHEINSAPVEKSRQERLEDLKELIRVNRYQTDYIKPKHKRPETFGLIQQSNQQFATN